MITKTIKEIIPEVEQKAISKFLDWFEKTETRMFNLVKSKNNNCTYCAYWNVDLDSGEPYCLNHIGG